MASVQPHPPTPQAPTTVVEVSWDDTLDGRFPPTYRQRLQQAAVRAAEQLSDGRLLDPARLAKALDLVLANAVTLQPDGTATVKSGSHSYHINGQCTCEDARHRSTRCKHMLAMLIHRYATALLEGTAHDPAARPTPVAPSPSAAAPQSEAPTATPAPASATWDVHEAPASACFRFRVGNLELLYTLRGIDDAELQTRIKDTLPLLQAIMEACEERAARRAAEREAAQAQQAPAAAGPQADLQALLQQAVQQAMATQANGQAKGHATRQGKPSDQQTGHCSLHDVEMELRQNERGAWYSHYLDDDGRYCKGATK